MVAVVVLLAAPAGLNSLSVVVDQHRQTIAKQQQEIATLTQAQASKQAAFAMHETCAAQADKVFRDLGYKLNGSNSTDVLQSHFNPERNKCFMTIETMSHDDVQRGQQGGLCDTSS